MCMLSGIFGECERSAHCILLVGVAAYPIAVAKPRPVRSSDATRSISTSKMCAEALFPTPAVPTYSVNPFYLSYLEVFEEAGSTDQSTIGQAGVDSGEITMRQITAKIVTNQGKLFPIFLRFWGHPIRTDGSCIGAPCS